MTKTWLFGLWGLMISCNQGLATFPRFADKLKDMSMHACVRDFDRAIECCVYTAPDSCYTRCLTDEGKEEIMPCTSGSKL